MKKTLIVFICLLVTGLVWHLRSEYGSGYSEEQRWLWNERRSLYPVSWVLGGETSWKRLYSSDFYGNVAMVTGTSEKEAKKLVEKNKEQFEALMRELEENRDQSGPDYKVEWQLLTDTSRLPLYGLSGKEIAERALAGDGDACLRMVQYLCYGVRGEGLPNLSWRGKHEVEKWLNRAVTLKRPGAEFLKNLFTEVWAFQKTRMGADGSLPAGVKFEVERTAGYHDFVECLRAGDYLVYRTAAGFISPDGMSREKKIIHKALLKGAEQGKAESQRDLALLCFEEEIFGGWDSFPYTLIEREIRQKAENWEKIIRWMPVSWQKEIMAGLFSCGVISAERTTAMAEYLEASKYARKAALQGDLTGKYLWLRYGITCMDRFSVREWEDILSYDRLLFESGYVPYINGVIVEGWNGDVLDKVILDSYYSEKSYREVRMRLFEEGGFTSRDIRFGISPGKDTLAEVRKNLQDFCLTGYTDIFLSSFLVRYMNKGGYMVEASQEVRDYLLAEVEKWATEGDLNAMYHLAGIYAKGIGVTADPGRAYALYKKALDGADELPRFSVSYIPSSAKNQNQGDSLKLKHAVRLKMAEMVLDYPDFPGRDEKEAYDLMLDSSRDIWVRDFCYYILGQFHEKGVGRPANREKALELYKKGTFMSKDCQEAVERLGKTGEKDKTEKK